MLAANQKEDMDEWLAEICKCMEEDQGSTSQRCGAETVYDCLVISLANKKLLCFYQWNVSGLKELILTPKPLFNSALMYIMVNMYESVMCADATSSPRLSRGHPNTLYNAIQDSTMQ